MIEAKTRIVTTEKPDYLYKFDYHNNYQNSYNSLAIDLFHIFTLNFIDFERMGKFLDEIFSFVLCDYGLLKSFYEYDEVDNAEFKGVLVNDYTKIIPVDGIKDFDSLIKYLYKHDKPEETINKAVRLKAYISEYAGATKIINDIIELLENNFLHIINNSFDIPIIKVETKSFNRILDEVIIQGDYEGIASFMRLKKKRDEYGNFKYPLIGITDGYNKIIIEESRKNKLTDDEILFSYNHISIDSHIEPANAKILNLFNMINENGRKNFLNIIKN